MVYQRMAAQRAAATSRCMFHIPVIALVSVVSTEQMDEASCGKSSYVPDPHDFEGFQGPQQAAAPRDFAKYAVLPRSNQQNLLTAPPVVYERLQEAVPRNFAFEAGRPSHQQAQFGIPGMADAPPPPPIEFESLGKRAVAPWSSPSYAVRPPTYQHEQETRMMIPNDHYYPQASPQSFYPSPLESGTPHDWMKGGCSIPHDNGPPTPRSLSDRRYLFHQDQSFSRLLNEDNTNSMRHQTIQGPRTQAQLKTRHGSTNSSHRQASGRPPLAPRTPAQFKTRPGSTQSASRQSGRHPPLALQTPAPLQNQPTKSSPLLQRAAAVLESPNVGHCLGIVDKRRQSLTNAQWQEIIFTCYTWITASKGSGAKYEEKKHIKAFAEDILKCPKMRRSINNQWNLTGLKELCREGVQVTDSRIQEKIESHFPVLISSKEPRTRDTRPGSRSALLKDEENVLISLLQQASEMTKSLDKPTVVKVVNTYLLEQSNGEIEPVCEKTVQRIYRSAKMDAKTKAHSIDPARASQADVHVLDTFSKLFDNIVHMVHQIDPEGCPWERAADVSAQNISNTDELGPNPTENRPPVIVPEQLRASLDRVFQSTNEGDGRMDLHYSIAMTERGDGCIAVPGKGIDGAAPEFFILSDKGSKNSVDDMDKGERDAAIHEMHEDDEITIPAGLLEGWFDGYNAETGIHELNPYGFNFRATPSGSMLKRIFKDLCYHFVNHLPQDQGPGGQWHFWFLDWHGSRANAGALRYCLRNKVFPIILPSKTSIWAQPCDGGPNLRCSKLISEAAAQENLLNIARFSHHEANRVFRAGTENCVNQENLDVLRTGENAATTAFRHTCLMPFRYDNTGWLAAFQIFGRLRQLYRKEKEEAGGEPLSTFSWLPRMRQRSERIEVTEEEIETLKQEAVVSDLHHYLIADHLAHRWLLEYIEDKTRDKNKPPPATRPIHDIILKLFCWSRSDERASTYPKDAEQIAAERSRTLLDVTEIGSTVCLEGGQAKCALKQSRTEWIVTSLKSGTQTLTTKELLNRYSVIRQKVVPTSKEAKKASDKVRRKRKVDQFEAGKKAKEEAKRLCEERNIDQMVQVLAAFTNDEGNPPSRSDLRKCSQLSQKPFSATLIVEVDGVPFPQEVCIAPTDNAASTQMSEIIVKILAQNAGKNQQRSRKKKNGISTKRGASGSDLALALEKQRVDEEETSADAELRKQTKIVASLQKLVDSANKLIQAKPASYWQVATLRGEALNCFDRIFKVASTVTKADKKREELAKLGIDRQKFDEKSAQLKEELEEAKREKMQPSLKARRSIAKTSIFGHKWHKTTAVMTKTTKIASQYIEGLPL